MSTNGTDGRKRVRLIDSTLRDGSHAMAHQFTSEQVKKIAAGLDAAGIAHPQRKAAITDHDSREPFDWSLRVSECVWGPTFVTLALERAPATAGNELRSAAV